MDLIRDLLRDLREILERLRFMRTKELNLAFDGFFIICRRHNLDIG